MGRQESQSRVRVAILDTGLDVESFEDNHELQGILRSQDHENPIKKMATFTESSAVDTHGHGTHTAALLLKIAPHAEVYIAKIANDGYIDDQGLENASRVSHCASLNAKLPLTAV